MIDTSRLSEPISISTVERVQAAIEALQEYHQDTYGVEEDGTQAFNCHNCQHCQAIKAMKQAINGIFTVIGLSAPYGTEVTLNGGNPTRPAG